MKVYKNSEGKILTVDGKVLKVNDGVLYEGEMTVGEEDDMPYLYRGFSPNVGSINPSKIGFNQCYTLVYEHPDLGIILYEFISDFPDLPANSLLRHEFGGTVYTHPESLHLYLGGQVGNTISLKIYED